MAEEEEEGKWRLLNPLCIRFSQPRIAPHFRDGHLLEETTAEVYETTLEAVESATRRHRPDAAEGLPPYDTVLVPPFPGIRVISWRPKIRNKDGEASRDAITGEQILGKRAWFALDNRRLHAMQFAAARRWPRRCCVVVRCIEEVPGNSAIRELRKFRTTTEGKSIEVGVRVGETDAWSWVDVAPAGAHPSGLEPEGLFAEDLFDASQWASHALKIACAHETSPSPEGCRQPRAPKEAAQERERARAMPTAGLALKLPPGAQARSPPPLGQGAEFLRAGAAGRGNKVSGPRLVACPSSGWQYVDPAGNVQGPFELEKMRLWWAHGFFYPDLPMRCDVTDRFVPLVELFPPGVKPFQADVFRFVQ